MPTKILISIILLSISTISQSATVYLDPVTQVKNIGDEVTVSLMGKDFTYIIEGGGINLSFNPEVLQLTNVSVDTAIWEFFVTEGIIDNTSGFLEDLTFSSFAGRRGNFSIAQITFQAMDVGSSWLNLSESALNPFTSGGELLNPVVNLTPGQITVVPLPPSILFLITSLGSFLLVNFKNRA